MGLADMTGSRLNVLLIHRFFKPDSPPYAFILDDIRRLLVEKGMLVDVLSSQPSYKSVDKKNKLPWKVQDESSSNIFRLPVFQFKNQKIAKLLNFVFFPLFSFCFVLLGKKYQVVSVSTAPPVVLAFFVALACKCRGFKLIYHCMDIHPEIGRISGEFKSKMIFKLLYAMDRLTCRTASKIIVLSEDMRASLLRRDKNLAPKIEIINNYDLSSEGGVNHGFFDMNDGKKRVIFAGNIGRFQNLDSFILALKNNPRLENFELLFVGEGTALEGIKNLAAGLEEQVRFIPHQPVGVARQMISAADIAIVSLQKEVIKFAFPSKTMTYLAEGTSILAMVEKDSELATFISNNSLGHVVEPGDSSGVYEVFKSLSENDFCFDCGQVINIFEKNFSRRQFNNKFISLLDGLA